MIKEMYQPYMEMFRQVRIPKPRHLAGVGVLQLAIVVVAVVGLTVAEPLIVAARPAVLPQLLILLGYALFAFGVVVPAAGYIIRRYRLFEGFSARAERAEVSDPRPSASPRTGLIALLVLLAAIAMVVGMHVLGGGAVLGLPLLPPGLE